MVLCPNEDLKLKKLFSQLAVEKSIRNISSDRKESMCLDYDESQTERKNKSEED
jgi:hypothetical protein